MEEADAATRKAKYGPVHIRLLLEKATGGLPLIVDKDWYGELCEKYVHGTARTKPNMHNATSMPVVGGVFQPAGLSNAIKNLLKTLIGLALFVCELCSFDDLVDEVRGYVRNLLKGRSRRVASRCRSRRLWRFATSRPRATDDNLAPPR